MKCLYLSTKLIDFVCCSKYAVEILLLLLFFLPASGVRAHSQNNRRTITGVVTSEGVRLEGVQILIKGTAEEKIPRPAADITAASHRLPVTPLYHKCLH